MAKRQPAPSVDAICAAIDAAMAGKGRRLAELVKGISTNDLAVAFGAVGSRVGPIGFDVLSRALSYASGMKEQRAIQAAERRQWRKEWKTRS